VPAGDFCKGLCTRARPVQRLAGQTRKQPFRHG